MMQGPWWLGIAYLHCFGFYVQFTCVNKSGYVGIRWQRLQRLLRYFSAMTPVQFLNGFGTFFPSLAVRDIGDSCILETLWCGGNRRLR